MTKISHHRRRNEQDIEKSVGSAQTSLDYQDYQLRRPSDAFEEGPREVN